MTKSIVVSIAASALAAAAQASIITQWNFNSNPADNSGTTGSTSASIGTGNVSVVTGGFGGGTFVSGTGSTDTAAADNTSYTITNGFTSSTGSGTRGFQLLSSTAGYWGIGFSWDHRNSATGIRYAQVQYTTNGTTWINANVVDLVATNGSFASFTGSGFSNATGNNANFGIRLVSVFSPPGGSAYNHTGNATAYGSSSNNGTWRIDMPTITGTANSAPTTTAHSDATTTGAPGITIDLATLWADVNTSMGDVVTVTGSGGPAEFDLSGNLLTFTAPASIVGASQTYTFNFTVTDAVGATSSSSVTYTVTPTPGAAALMGLGLVAAGRRRRA